MPRCYNKIYIKKYDIHVDCGKCLNCEENRKRETSLRMQLESSNYINKYFVTLTYDPMKATYDEKGQTVLNKKHIKAYIEALQYVQKQHYQDKYKLEQNKLKYIVSGEYGENQTKRAHYHLIIATNIYIERYLRTKWKYGRVDIQRIKSMAAINYTSQYSAKKMGRKDDREIKPFVKWSKGLGKKWIHEAIAKKKIDYKNYFVETLIGKYKLPKYFKNEIKYSIMGVRPKYQKIKDEEIAKREKRKTFMVNHYEYYNRLELWNNFVEKIKIELRKNSIEYLMYDKMQKRYGIKWKQRVYNLLYNEKWEELDTFEKEFCELEKQMNNKLRIEAEIKYWHKSGKRGKVA